MKVIILAGGFGTRLSEYTDIIPKPMVMIGGKPILLHIMQRFAAFGYNDFFIALGYKGELIKEYFKNYHTLNSNFTVNLKTGLLSSDKSGKLDWRVTLVDTGLHSMTGGRLKRLQRLIGNETFFFTYGDGLADVSIDKLAAFHKLHKKMITVTAVHPIARFGELEIKNGIVISFNEKPQIREGWINGGFFVIEPQFFDFIEDDNTILEKEPLETVSRMGELMAYRHEGFWHCMDTKRDHDLLERLWKNNKALW